MRYLLLAVSVVGMLATDHQASIARTWVIHPDGSGDAPTIDAAADSSATGDTLLIEPGTYEEMVSLKPGTFLIASAGPATTVLDSQGGFSTVSGESVWIEGLTLAGAANSYGFSGVPLSGNNHFEGYNVRVHGTSVCMCPVTRKPRLPSRSFG